MIDQRAGRRGLPQLPQNLSTMPWNTARTAIYIFLLKLRQHTFGIPGGWKGAVPPIVPVGGTPSAGDGDTAGWVAADAVYAVAAGQVNTLLLGQTAGPGAATSAPRADFRQQTITLQQQIRALISLRIG